MSIMMIHFEWLWAFLFLPLPILVYLFVPAAQPNTSAIRLPFFQSLSKSDASTKESKKGIRMGLFALLWLLLVVAAGRPQMVGEFINQPVSGRDLMMAVDISGSMKTRDIPHNQQTQSRLDAVKRVAGEFIQQRIGDRIGLILFGTQAYLQAPLSLDRNTINAFLNESLIGIAGEKTSIGDAIGLAIKRLESRENTDKILILLTDGSNTAGSVDPWKAAELANVAGLKIHTVGIGATALEVEGFFGTQTINPSEDLDEALLQFIATSTGGQYFRATDEKTLAKIYELINQLEPVDGDLELLRPVRELFFWPLGLVVIIALFWMLLSHYSLGKLKQLFQRDTDEMARAMRQGNGTGK